MVTQRYFQMLAACVLIVLGVVLLVQGARAQIDAWADFDLSILRGPGSSPGRPLDMHLMSTTVAAMLSSVLGCGVAALGIRAFFDRRAVRRESHTDEPPRD